jgi:hypothetical protein
MREVMKVSHFGFVSGLSSAFGFGFNFVLETEGLDASGEDEEESEVASDVLVEDVGVRNGGEGGEGGVDDDG